VVLVLISPHSGMPGGRTGAVWSVHRVRVGLVVIHTATRRSGELTLCEISARKEPWWVAGLFVSVHLQVLQAFKVPELIGQEERDLKHEGSRLAE
jgi:hypothetical protein